MPPRDIVFLWENFGPYHEDRCEAVAARLGPSWNVFGIELSGTSNSYGWHSEQRAGYRKDTLVSGIASEEVPFLTRLLSLLKACLPHRGGYFFFCHYERPATLLVAGILRLLGQSVFTMSESKFDDYDRFLYREVVKSLFYIPYQGALASSARTKDYLRFLGFSAGRVADGYNTVSVDRIRRLAGVAPAPDGTLWSERHFTIVARLVPKKNLSMALEAYALYRRSVPNPRLLHVCGSGPLESELRERAAALEISDSVHFRGWLQDQDTCRTLGTSLALLLPSIEEQFGNVVIEAQAMGLPVILSENCGARDYLVRTGLNGFVVEPDNPKGLAFFMRLLCQDEVLWREMALAAASVAALGDAGRFAEGVVRLMEMAKDEHSGDTVAPGRVE